VRVRVCAATIGFDFTVSLFENTFFTFLIEKRDFTFFEEACQVKRYLTFHSQNYCGHFRCETIKAATH